MAPGSGCPSRTCSRDISTTAMRSQRIARKAPRWTARSSWGPTSSTGLTRHRIEARFFVTATPTYVNEPPAPLEPGAGVTAKVARMLGASGAKTMATGDVDGARDPGHVLGARLRALESDLANTRRFRRARRAQLERQIDACRRKLSEPLPSVAPEVARPNEPRPGRDPLAGLDRARQRGRERGMGREL
jgi:hypothetical protein